MVDRADIERLAELSRIALGEEELERLCGDIEQIVNYVSEIREADTLAPEERAREREAVRNVFRDDGPAHESGIFSERLLAAAPEREGRFVKVKKIL
jgi:aspartyl-tRNA(Asn)/glutamyl-tRNA(Gln) amidotransferase subunit C